MIIKETNVRVIEYLLCGILTEMYGFTNASYGFYILSVVLLIVKVVGGTIQSWKNGHKKYPIDTELI